MKISIPMVAGLIMITTSFLTGCSSTSSPTASSSSKVQTSTASPSTQAPASSSAPAPTASKQATSSPASTTSANARVTTCLTQHLTLTQGPVGAAAGSTYVTYYLCLLYTSPSPRDRQKSRMPSSA